MYLHWKSPFHAILKSTNWFARAMNSKITENQHIAPSIENENNSRNKKATIRAMSRCVHLDCGNFLWSFYWHDIQRQTHSELNTVTPSDSGKCCLLRKQAVNKRRPQTSVSKVNTFVICIENKSVGFCYSSCAVDSFLSKKSSEKRKNT